MTRCLARIIIAAVIAGSPSITTLGAAEVTVSGPQPPVADRIVPVGAITYAVEADGLAGRLSFLPADDSLLLDVGEPGERASLTQQAGLLDPLFAAVLRDHPGIQQFDVLIARHDEIVTRLQDVLARSADWDRAKGRARHGNLDVFLANSINANNLAREITAVFAAHGYTLRVHSLGLVTDGVLQQYGGARLPTSIARIEFHADKANARS